MPNEVIVAKKNRAWEIAKRMPYQTVTFAIVYIVLYYTIPRDSDTYALLRFDSDLPREAYRWWTYSLLHWTPTHLYMNITMLILYGILLEYTNMVWRTFLIYQLAILGGAFGAGWYLRIVPNNIYLVGASGGIYGLLAAQSGYLIINWPEMDVLSRIIHTSFLIAPTVSDIVVSSIHPNPQTSYSAHVGGFIAGVMASICLVRNIRVYRWENITKITVGCLFGVYLIAGGINLLTLHS